jgi:hypothetical protein
MPESDKVPVKKKVLDRIGTLLKKRFDETEKNRQLYREDEWMESLRQVKGIYDPDIQSKVNAKGMSKIYPRYTRGKVVPAIAKLNDLLFPDNDRNWQIKPTPNPRLEDDQIQEIVDALNPVDADGNPREVTQDEVEFAIQSFVIDRTRKMQETMDDQLTEARYRTKAKAQIRSGVFYGTGILKGPLSKSSTVIALEKREDGSYGQSVDKKYDPFIDNVSLWRWFPDMTSVELEHCNFVFELHSMTKHELRRLAKKKGFDSKAINKYIKTQPDGDYRLRNWEIDLRTMKGDESVKRDTENYEVLEYNGYLDGSDLKEIGVLKDDDDAEKDWFVSAWILGKKVIKLTVYRHMSNPAHLYHVFYYEKDESSIFGEGLIRIIRDTQLAICSGKRAMLDNASWVAGPILEINGDLISEEPLGEVYPGRVFQREGEGPNAQYPAIRVYNIDSHIGEMVSLLNKLEADGDMESTLPALLTNETVQGKNETEKGVSIRETSRNLTIHDIVKQFDESNESLIRQLYHWNMKYNPDDTIKGDMEVKAVGSSSLVSKEVRTQALDFFAQTLDDEDKVHINRRKFLRRRIKMRDLQDEDIMNSEAEANQIMEANRRARAEAEAREAEKMAAETRYELSKAAHMESKAKAVLEGLASEELEKLAEVLSKIRESRREE